MATFAPFFEKQMNPLKFVLHQDMIKQYQKCRHQGADKKHTNQSPPSNQMSQIADRRIEKPGDVLSEGQIVDAKITAVDEEKQKISLSIRALLNDGDEDAE